MSAARCARQAAAWAGPYAHAVQVASQADIDAHSAGTRYALAVGTHNLSLVPKSGDSIVGLGAATVLNGGASTAHGISDGGGTVTNVTIRNLEVNNYAPSFQKGSIDVSGSGSTGWTVVNVTAITSTGRGISGDSGGMLAYGGRYSGHAGVAAGNVRLLYACELDHSGTHGQEANEAGGTKWAVRNPTTVQSCWVHDNIGVGVWSDINAFDITVVDNDIWDSSDEGIQIEISEGPITVQNNRLLRCGVTGGNSWHWGNGIGFYASGGDDSSHRGDCSGNTVTSCFNGVGVVQQTRADGSPGLCQHLNIHDNTIHDSGMTGAIADNGADLTTRDIIGWASNTLTGSSTIGNAHGLGFY